jgi:hypothetical protein
MKKFSYLIVFISIAFATSGRLGGSFSWLRSKKSSENESHDIKQCFSLRAGATTDKPNGNDKIKGVCIGIDLGTTYRLSIKSTFFIQFLIFFSFIVALQFGKMDE